jgi:hypothetical protein
MYKKMFSENTVFIALLIFAFTFGTIQYWKPSFLYKADGSIREFGVGYKNKTVLPVWLLSFILGILSYLVAMTHHYM